MEEKQTAAACGGGVAIEILMRLPVKSLLRFKSVCKSWRDLIQSSFFIDLHTTAKTTSSSNFGSFMLHALQRHGSGSCEYGDWYWGSDDTWHKRNAGGVWNRGDDTNCGWYWVTDDDQLVLKLNYFGQILPLSCFREAISGSCNGLICLYDSSYIRTFSLWNPATGQFRIIPESITIQEKEEGIKLDDDFMAFGFDVKTQDYKVVQITTYFDTTLPKWNRPGPVCICRVQVYSLSTDSWRILEGINSLPGKPIHGHQGLYLNGHCFFMAAYPDGQRFIISFDFTKEIFTTMELPQHDHGDELSLCCLGGENETMALFITLPNYEYEDCDIWVLNQHCSCGGDYDDDGGYDEDCDDYDGGYEDCDDYDGGYEDCDICGLTEPCSCYDDGEHCSCCGGVYKKEDSWTKLHSFQIKNNRGIDNDNSNTTRLNDRGNSNSTRLRGVSNNGKFALLETRDSELYRKIQLYNLVTKEAKMDLLLFERLSTAHVYKPSLVSVIGGNGSSSSSSPSPSPDDRVMIGGGAL